MAFDPSICIAVATIIGGVASLWALLVGRPIFSVFRDWQRHPEWDDRFFDYLPGDERYSKILDPVKRRIGRNQNQQALTDLDAIRQGMSHSASLGIEPDIAGGDPFLTANLLLYRGEAMLYLGDKEVVSLFREVIRLIEQVNPDGETKIQKKEHILGRAHNNIGYFYRSIKDYPHAEWEYRQAISHLRRSKNLSAYAHTKKNLAYIYALQGKVVAAEILCQDAIEIFQGLGDNSGKAFSLNTLGLVQVEGRQHEVGKMRCGGALSIFQVLDDQRGIGLASVGLGYILRRLSSRDTNSPAQTHALFQEAVRHLTRSVRIFTKVGEPARLVEACGELGCTYRDWARLSRSLGDSPAQTEKLENEALINLQKSFDLASELGMTVEKTDVLEDVAQVYFDRREYKRALHVLDQAEALIPREYFIDRVTGLPKVKDPVTPFWSVLGKTALLRGHIDFERELEENTSRWYELASAYFGLYAKTTTLADYAVRSVYARLRGLSPDRLISWRLTANSVEKEYGLDRTKLIETLDETLGVLDLSSDLGHSKQPAQT